MTAVDVDKVKAAMLKVADACEDTGDFVYTIRNVIEASMEPEAEKNLSLLQYIMVRLRAKGMDEDELYLLTAAAIARAYSVPLKDCEDPFEEEPDVTPHYPAEPGELN